MLRAKAIYYLLMYNLFFILPLVFVFLVAYFGISSQKMSEIMKRKLGIVKLATACLFFGLASLLILLKV
ncbi:MAG: hypothetical protein HY769_06170 [Candidatus Stahlbacteria bacterium]|nr:hypothetical protein [Candidatus Stahlbacteria bacterium]